MRKCTVCTAKYCRIVVDYPTTRKIAQSYERLEYNSIIINTLTPRSCGIPVKGHDD